MGISHSTNCCYTPVKTTMAVQSQVNSRTPLKPYRMRDESGCLLPKVFIAYPHNPSCYTEVESDIDFYRKLYPGEPDHILQQKIDEVVQQHKIQQREQIKQHEVKVYHFAKFLQQACVAVAYDLLLTDVGAENIMRWCQEQIEDSDMVILIVTKSFNEFLNGEVPLESEQLFAGNYFSNFIHNPQGKILLPVFVDQPIDTQLIPRCLEMCKCYSITTPLVLGRGDDLDALYALLTRQDRFAPPAPLPGAGPIKVNPNKRRRIGAGVTTDVIQRDSASVVSGSHHRHLLESLMKLHCAPTDLLITTVSDKPLFSTHWRELAKHLDLSDAEIERCEARGIRDEAENCLQMLTLWRNTRAGAATVAVLADAVYNKCRNMNMLEILHGACESCVPVV